MEYSAELTATLMFVDVFKELDPDDPKLELPWVSATDPTLRYTDLKLAPERIGELEECRKFPALAGLLRVLNTPQSVFRTVRCDVWATTELAEDERVDFDDRLKIGSYVDLVFERPDFQLDLRRHIRLGETLTQRLTPLQLLAQIDIVVRRCLFQARRLQGYGATIFVHAYGSSLSEAEAEWTRTLDALGSALLEFDQNLRKRTSKRAPSLPERC